VNISPKGPIGSLRVLGPREVAYLDVSAAARRRSRTCARTAGSSSCSAPSRARRRSCACTAAARSSCPRTRFFAELVDRAAFDETADPIARRAVVRVDVERISDACGYGVPLMAYEGERPHYAESVDKKVRTGGPDAHRRYQDTKNAVSIDGLPAVPQRLAR
jgi:hypothetical protein